jgi:putative PEP-CTERM system histidine kinase
MIALHPLWPGLESASYTAGALACLLCTAWLTRRRESFGAAHRVLLMAVAATGIWSAMSALAGAISAAAAFGETLRNLAWVLALYRLFAVDGRHASVRPVRPVLVALVAAIALAVPLSLMPHAQAGHDGPASEMPFYLALQLRLLVAIGALVLVHNLYGGASTQARLALRWPAAALAAMWLFDLNYLTIAYLVGSEPAFLATLRGLVGLSVAGPLAFGSLRGSEELRFRPSRAVTFQSISLILIGGYLAGMVAVAQWLAYGGGNSAGVMQAGLVVLSSLGVLALLPSKRLRGWVRVTLTKHLFQHRYDYRAEWLRFTRTIGDGGGVGAPLNERIIRSLADITDSTSGILLTIGENGGVALAARWQWPTIEVPAEAMDAAAVRFFERHGFIADLDDVRAAHATHGEAEHIPEWLLQESRAWALVPLLHFERLVGIVVLARPPLVRQLDWEDFDLLRVVGQQLASYLAEQEGQEALAEASRFDDFHRRIAFVMHDIKNLASQLSLLARNAEQHAGNPEFQADMLVTLRNSADKLNALLARLSRYGSTSVEAPAPVRLDEVAAAVVEQFRDRHPVTLVTTQPCVVAAQRDPLEQALVHLVQNAIDASSSDAQVCVGVGVDGMHGHVEVIDSGQGMSPEFVRSRLFKPFVSSKQGGFGIGAYEARELVRAMHGLLDVDSREGLGSRFTIRLPLAGTTELLKTMEDKRVA